MINDLIGVKYKPHGRNLDGIDCYGLIIEVYKRLGVTLQDIEYEETDIKSNAYIDEVMRKTLPVEKIDKPEKYCIVELKVAGFPSHVGIYIGKGELLHADRKQGVVIEQLQRWENRIAGYYRVKGGLQGQQ